MRSTFKQLYYINRSKVKADGTTAIWCRITIDGKQAVLSTGIYCHPNDWNSKKGEVRDIRTNGRLSQYRRHIGNIYDELLKKQGVVSAELLKNTLVAESTQPTTLIQMGKQELERLKKRSVEIQSRSTYRQSVIFQDCICQYIESVYRREDMPLEDITEQFGRDYKTFLLKELGCSTDKMNKCLCWLNRLLYLAVDREIIRANPVEDVEYEKKNPPKLKHISRNELKRLMATPFEDGSMELARRMFIFSSFCGLAYVDVYKLYPHHIGEAADGRKYIRKREARPTWKPLSRCIPWRSVYCRFTIRPMTPNPFSPCLSVIYSGMRYIPSATHWSSKKISPITRPGTRSEPYWFPQESR